MNGAAQYAVLAVSTGFVAALTVAVWWKTRQVAFVLGFFFLYYWSLHGAWAVIARQTGAPGQYRFEYMYQKLFPVYLDDYYIWTIALYALFIVTVQITVLFVARSSRQLDSNMSPLRMDHRVMIVIGTVLACGAFLIVKEVLSVSAALSVAPYAVIGAIQSDNNPAFKLPLFSLYQVLNETALGCLTLGVAVLVSGDNPRFIEARPRRWPIIGYAIFLSALFALNLLLGNRSMLVSAILPSGLFYLANARRRSVAVLVTCGIIAGAGIIVPGIVRSGAAMREMKGQSLSEKAVYVMSEAFSQQTESFATHASMYGALSKHVPLTYGSSLLWLAESVIPRMIRPNLSTVIYDHYAMNVGAAADQGFTIHHATGWYLNFGIPGLLGGAILFGTVWAKLMNRVHRISLCRSHLSRVFTTIAVWNFTGFIPTFIRGGPESYKGLTVEALIIPTAILAIACLRVVARNNRPCLVPADRTRF